VADLPKPPKSAFDAGSIFQRLVGANPANSGYIPGSLGAAWQNADAGEVGVTQSPLHYPELVSGQLPASSADAKAITVPVDEYNSHPDYAYLRAKTGKTNVPVVVYRTSALQFPDDRAEVQAHERIHTGQMMLNNGLAPEQMVPKAAFQNWLRTVPADSPVGSSPQYEAPAYLFSRAAPPAPSETTIRPGSKSDQIPYLQRPADFKPDPNDVVPMRPVMQESFNRYMQMMRNQYPKNGFYLEANSPDWLESQYIRSTPPPAPQAPPVNMKQVSLLTGKKAK
jgi:hypothetical protein